jgi:hypothetical protein
LGEGAVKTAAARQKLYRSRQARGITLAIIEAPPFFLEYLIHIGAVADAQTADPKALGEAIMKWAGHMMAVDLA